MAFPNYKRRGHVLYPGDELHANECLVSECGRFYVCLQPDGNLVEYRWTAKGIDIHGISKTHHDSYGYDQCKLRWGPRGQIVLQDNIGNTYWEMFHPQTEPLPEHPQELVIQKDSNFVYYKKGNHAVWSSKCHSHSAAWVIPDGRVVTCKQVSYEPGAPGQLDILTGFDHVTLNIYTNPPHVALPFSKVAYPVQPGTLEIVINIPHAFDANGKPRSADVTGVCAKLNNVDIRPGETHVLPISSQSFSSQELCLL